MIKNLLWDVDGTLLDFKAAESAAIRRLFGEFSLGECTDEMIRWYSSINEGFWQRLERNEITKQQVLIGRYEQFSRKSGFRYRWRRNSTGGTRYGLAIRLFSGMTVSVL